jgi:two-component system OmpR family response regulator
MRILLVEDDPMIGEAVSIALKDAAYAVDWVEDGATAVSTLEHGEHQAVLLDLGLPKRDGLAVLRRLRDTGNRIPVIVITARDGVDDRILGLDAGADDYLVKPFDVNELLARLRAVVRRQAGTADPILSNGKLSLNPATHEASHGDIAAVLSAREFALLHTLLLHPGRIFSRAELETHLYGWNEEVESNAVDFLIHGIRRKLGAAAIKNVRGAGWLVDRKS